MATITPNSEWLKKLGIDKERRLVAMTGGCMTLTVDTNDVYILWMFDYPLVSGCAEYVRAEYAKYVPEWLKWLYV